MSAERETRLLMISPDSKVTPDQLSRTVHAMGRRVTVKETCYGCLVEGPADVVREIRDEIRKMDPNGIYSKVRAYPCGDPRRCRAQHGSRPGFSQLETEWATLPMIQHGLDAVGKGVKPIPKQERRYLPVEDFKRICEVK